MSSSFLEPANQGMSGLLRALTTSSLDRTNEANRAVCEYLPCSIDAFFDSTCGTKSTIISGGDKQLRTEAIRAQVQASMSNRLPVIILHEGDCHLEHVLQQSYSSSNCYREIGTSSPCFEPFYSLTALEIARETLETAPKEYELKSNAQFYIEALCEYLKYAGRHTSFKMLSTCPHAQMFDKVDDLEQRGVISASVSQELKAKLMMGQTECYKLNSFLGSFRMEADSVMYHPKSGFRPVNIVSAVKNREILCIDVSSVTNQILMNTVFYQLRLALQHGAAYTLIIDSLPLAANEMYMNFIKSSACKVHRLFATDDLYSMLGGEDNLFSTLVGNSDTVMIFAHTAGKSAEKWSEFLGQYDKYERSFSQTRGTSRAPFSLFSSSNSSRSINVAKNREFIVKPEQLMRMAPGEAYVRMADDRQIAHLLITE